MKHEYTGTQTKDESACIHCGYKPWVDQHRECLDDCPECGDASSCECPLADNYRQIDAPEPPTCPHCLDSGYRRDWSGKRVGCDCCYPDNGKD
jgi:hypothetical protein